MANPFRPLQPAPMDGQEQAPPPPVRPLLPITQKPKRTVTLGACVACRRRKSKCDGSRPTCTCCTQKDTECVYELGPNEKPSQAMKRKNEEMQGELLNLRQLYDFLRLRPEAEAQEILRRIRSDPHDTAPTQRIQELADFVRHGDSLVPQAALAPTMPPPSDVVTLPPLRMALGAVVDSGSAESGWSTNLPFPSGYLSTDAQGPASQRRRHASDADVSARSDSAGSLPPPTSIRAILQEPLFTKTHDPVDPRLSSAVNWTNVTDDTSLVVHLMSSFYRGEYKYWHFFDWECFVQDMHSGQMDFCSKLLVNAILASASFQSPMVKERSEPFANNIITLFYEEARRLWELEEGQDRLTRLQAALLLYLVLGKHGRDKVGHMFLGEACRVGHNVGLFRLSSTTALQKPPGVPVAKWERCRAVTAWALFNFQLTMSFTYSFAPMIKSQPPVPVPYDDAQEAEAFFRSECARQVIMLDALNTLWDEIIAESDIPPKPEQVEVLYLRLKSWWELRPQSLGPTANPTPENLLTAMLYHCANIRLCQPFLRRDSSLERVKSYAARAEAISTASMKDLRHLLILHEVRQGWSNAIPYVLHAVMICSIGSAEELARDIPSVAHLPSSEIYQGLLTCLRALSALSSFIFYAQPLFRMVTQTCQTLGIRLPSEVISTLDHYQTEAWTKNAATMVSSQYVADVRKTASDMDNSRMDCVIAQWDAMTIADGKSSVPGEAGHPSVSSARNEGI